MALTRVYSSDPGADVLLGSGPALNIIEVATQNAKNARGRGILGLIGAVVNDRGTVNQAITLENGIDDLFGQYGGFKSWLGDVESNAGATSGYNGNLAAQCWKLSAPAVRLVIPDLAIKDAAYSATANDVLISFTRSDAANGEVTIPAGTRLSNGSTFQVATLEDVYYSAAETGSKTCRVRQVSVGVDIADFDAVTTFVDSSPDANITVNTSSTVNPTEIDLADLVLRYTAAFNAINDTVPGQQITVAACDRVEKGINSLLTTHCSTSTSSGYWRIACVSPPVGTTAALARTGGSGNTGSVDDAAYTTARMVYCHPSWTRSFALDSTNLVSPAYTATFPSAITTACRIVQEKPEQNPGTPHQSLTTWGATGLESLSGGSPDVATHWGANITQPIFERSPDGSLNASYHDAIMANGTKVADRRMRDYLQEALILVVRPYHKQVATKANRDGAVNAVIAKLRELYSPDDPSQARIGTFGVTSIWDAANNHLRIKCVIALLGNMDVITLHVDAQTSNADVVVEEAA